MNPTAQKLLDAHVKFVLSKLSGKEIATTIGEESKIVFQWTAQQSLSDIFSQEKVKSFGERMLSEAEISDATKAYTESLIGALLDDIAKEDIEIDDLITKSTWDKIIDKVVEQRELRQEIVRRLTRNQAYGAVLSEIIYNSIKTFMQQNPFGGGTDKEDKGLGGLFNMGKSILGSALSGVEDSIDKNVKKFLSDNINKTLRDSEKIILARLTDDNIRKAADQLWGKLDDLNFKEIAQRVKKYSSNGKQTTSDLTSTIVLEVKESKAFKHISTFALNHFYETYGNQPISVLFDGLKITEERVSRDAVNIAEDILNQMNTTGFLEERVREHLSKFYETTEVQQILS